jgi:hypothetical protein
MPTPARETGATDRVKSGQVELASHGRNFSTEAIDPK